MTQRWPRSPVWSDVAQEPCSCCVRSLSTARAASSRWCCSKASRGSGSPDWSRSSSARLSAREDALMVRHCVELVGDELPFGVAADALRDLVRRHGEDRIRAVSPTAFERLGPLRGRPAGHPDGRGGRAEIFEAFVALVADVAATRMLCLVVEDLQWVDTSSRDLLTYLVRVVGPARLLVVGTRRSRVQRDDPVTVRVVDELARDRAVTRYGWTRSRATRCASSSSRCSRTPPDVRLLGRAFELAQGVPAMTELVLGGLQPSGPVPRAALDAGAWSSRRDHRCPR